MKRVSRILAAQVITTDVESNEELTVDFGLRIPVVRVIGGSVLAEGRITFWRLLLAGIGARTSFFPRQQNR